VSVKAVATVFKTAPVLTVLAAPGTDVTVPTVKPALVIIVFAVAISVPRRNRWFIFFSNSDQRYLVELSF
jgi:hypothetical protein